MTVSLAECSSVLAGDSAKDTILADMLQLLTTQRVRKLYAEVYIDAYILLKAFFERILIIFNLAILAKHKEKPGNLQLFCNGGSSLQVLPGFRNFEKTRLV
jgi:hypothetical protein